MKWILLEIQSIVRPTYMELNLLLSTNLISTRVIGPRLPSGGIGSGFEDAVDEEDLMRLKRQREKAENKMLRRRKESDLEELVPKETGREAMLEKRRAKGAHARREDSPDVELNDSELLGGDSFNAAVARQRARNNVRLSRKQNIQLEKEAQLKARVEQHRAKEEATVEMFRKMAAAHRPPPS
ncbi:hypothetical protein DSO57_1011094 [Entomophthora muscae]|nr:hypothetical protein DSO57_1011094 [Entomophthora muscae]